MTTVSLNHMIKDETVIFTVSEPISSDFQFTQPSVRKQFRSLYKERYQLNNWRTFDKSVMKKEFGR